MTSRVEAQSALEEKFSMRVRPAASDASIAALCDTDLSPGTLRRPRSRRAGLISMRAMVTGSRR